MAFRKSFSLEHRRMKPLVVLLMRDFISINLCDLIAFTTYNQSFPEHYLIQWQ
jgi:hypothetical protein